MQPATVIRGSEGAMESARLDVMAKAHQAKVFSGTGTRPSYKQALMEVSG
jgi:hypothetical protein